MEKEKEFKTLKEFYPHYLSEHSDSTNRYLHFAGTILLLACLVAGIITGIWWLFVLIPVLGYGFAWAGHYFIEKNRPATFTYPLYSLASDFIMFWDMLTGKLNNKIAKNKNTNTNSN